MIDLLMTLAQVAGVIAALALFAAWCVVVVCCAQDAFAPEPEPQLHDFRPSDALERARIRRADRQSTYPGRTPAWTPATVRI